MVGVIINYAYAIGLLFLMSGIQNPALLVLGWVMTIWFVVTASLVGWAIARQ